MTRSNSLSLTFKVVSLIAFLGLLLFFLEATSHSDAKELILNSEQYHDSDVVSIAKQLIHRIKVQPFNAIAFLIFAIAIIHTFFARKISQYSISLENDYKGKNPTPLQLFLIEFLYFMGEVEVILG